METTDGEEREEEKTEGCVDGAGELGCDPQGDDGEDTAAADRVDGV